MGKYKFRLSDMIPNAWFYKLKDMSKPRKNQSSNSHHKKKNQPPTPTFSSSAKPTSPAKPKQVTYHHHHCPQSRKSYYFTRELNNTTGENRPLCNTPINPTEVADTSLPHEPTRKSSRQKPRKSRIATSKPSSDSKLATSTTSSVSAGGRASIESVWTKSDSPPEEQLWSSSSLDSSELEFHHPEPLEFRCDRVLATETDGMISMTNSYEKDIIIDVGDSAEKNFDSFSELQLPRIITKPENFSEIVSETKKKKKDNAEQPIKSRKSSHGSENNKDHRASSDKRVCSSTPGIKLRANSPRIANRKLNQAQVARRSVSSNSSSKRRSLSESFAIVKSSFDPQRDFRESMIEMIMENNIKASKDLEDLLACYLSLNADEYHELIIKVFKQIWFDLTDIRSK
ncbi:transcription repressor OFP4 [Argentina anserina]|uniref:transcription repressor OFP4 n=1 Tax=Argentina anserina TaxID=57926 RepID=UPI0021763BFE|nr:transcription repressor OFP4 [Potentilla anserina]